MAMEHKRKRMLACARVRDDYRSRAGPGVLRHRHGFRNPRHGRGRDFVLRVLPGEAVPPRRQEDETRRHQEGRFYSHGSFLIESIF